MTENSTTSAAPTTPTPTPAPSATTPSAPNVNDSVALAKQVGELQAKAKEYDEYKQKVDPVLETLYSDTELLNKATEVHNRRLGKGPTAPAPTTPSPQTPTTPTAPPFDQDNRNATLNLISNQFEEKVGINKLPDDQKEKVRGMVGTMLKNLVDPRGNKSIPQVFEEVSLAKLPWYLERAYDLVTKDDQLKAATERGKNEVLSQYEGDRGVMGSMPSGSVPIDSITLTPSERAVAKKQGVSEDEYLKNKKAILELRNS